ncbi:MAG: iojap protein [Francisellaceae bacterium]|nr:iojap protein [Francisellaceae bacterium]
MSNNISLIVKEALEDLKAQNICVLPVSSITSVTDYMIIASGTSTKHAQSIAGHVIDELKKQNIQTLSLEGLQHGEWVLIDFGDAIVHIMSPIMREFYQLEKLWTVVKNSETYKISNFK